MVHVCFYGYSSVRKLSLAALPRLDPTPNRIKTRYPTAFIWTTFLSCKISAHISFTMFLKHEQKPNSIHTIIQNKCANIYSLITTNIFYFDYIKSCLKLRSTYTTFYAGHNYLAFNNNICYNKLFIHVDKHNIY